MQQWLSNSILVALIAPHIIIFIAAAAVLLLIVLIVSASLIISGLNRKRIRTMFSNVEKVLTDIVNVDKENSELKKIEYESKKAPKMPYDYILKTNDYLYYIKVVDNNGGHEICVNNSVKWQIRKSFNDESMHFVPEIEELMRMELPREDENRIPKKIYIIYPNARSLLRYINECEMEFVHPNTDVYGTNIITYNDLKENIDFIPRTHEKKNKEKNTQLSLKI